MINRIDKKEKTSKKRIEKLIRGLLIELGENPDRDLVRRQRYLEYQLLMQMIRLHHVKVLQRRPCYTL